MADIDLVIKIPEEKYLYAKNLVNNGKENNPVVLAVGNGTPFSDTTINSLREEIGTYYADCSLSISENDERCKQCTDTMFCSVLQIIDKYRK